MRESTRTRVEERRCLGDDIRITVGASGANEIFTAGGKFYCLDFLDGLKSNLAGCTAI